MPTKDVQLPLIDLSGYIAPKAPGDRERVIAEVRDAASGPGFFQVKGHGVTVEQQRGLFSGIDAFFSQSKEEKLKYSFLDHPCRRGYEAAGDSLRNGDAMADAKEAFYLGKEHAEIEHLGFYGPNNWPDLPEKKFREPVWDYYQATSKLGEIIWEILLLGLGHDKSAFDAFIKKPMVPLKLIRYPKPSKVLPGQYGAGAHRDFGGVTVLLQQPGKPGLEVWMEEQQDWLEVPAQEDIFIINCGDMIEKWSGGQYKSVWHRVINKTDSERLSCAIFWHGDVMATNPLNPSDPDKVTVGQLWMKRFKTQMQIDDDVAEHFAVPS